MTSSNTERFAASALGGLRIIDFTHFIAGPLATMIVADAGADVIKVEKPQGDDQRHFAPSEARLDGEGASFLWANRNKRSITLDLKTAEGREIAQALVRSADVVVENFSSRVMAQYGLDYETLSGAHPELIYCSVSAFGRTGAYASRLGFDTIMQAESGFMSLNGHADREGVRAGPAVMDMATAMMASNAILIALAARHRTGRGQHVDVPLFDTAVLMTGFMTAQYLFSHKVPRRNGNVSNDAVPSGVFQTADHPIFVTCTSTALFRRLFIEVANMPAIGEEPALQKIDGRMAARDRIIDMLDELFRTDTQANWLARLAKGNIPAGAVRSLSEALVSPETKARGIVTEIAHPTAGKVPNVALPLYFSETPVVPPIAAPTLGQHSEEVLADVLGYDALRIRELREAGVLGKARS
ncbi:CaiB/BaiF CoA-transferase family protein [Variovorax sp. 770b2]|uniref:CaiB/BaiF CoA transferase family protein n=1 Tax=Variovorax sp. 770b2 TaxID=1566271 RepID=UPI0008EDCCF9|nr:CoA transferase [Variovorax sp. 770b2]SFP26730.1 Crotonobetainyl-CoA:carnitine CoA-transferase CaiB [Variovorax sp. 770b2]